MQQQINVFYAETSGQYWMQYIDFPDVCPYCKHSCAPVPITAQMKDDKIFGCFKCTKNNCNHLFLVTYCMGAQGWHLWNIEPQFPIKREFSENISNVSQQFVDIYNEAYQSESYWLHQISWVWYRKSLEFLIKDYLIQKNPEKEEEIKQKFLWNCINDDLEEGKIKLVAKRAVWLWNDETHYVRKWEDKDITDLKKLIELTVNWIEMEKMTEEYTDGMQ